ncbi:hypothetical protein [Planctomycetes bacterium TBK1r]|uniref:Uncharacterized protein n=1 Tax=Stieleria magnilauensis TaxID=2527963 RepID=A0ABX5Y125_9BACT|nr:hypothetical protein TBK1r_69660 [Planctomycetes bacterium TBK1r]
MKKTKSINTIEPSKKINRMFYTRSFQPRRDRLALIVLATCLLMPLVGCGGPAPPEIDTDISAEIQAEDEAIIDAESEL